MKRIVKIEIENSEFFKNEFQFDFSEKLNCIMGGRGTGKSTLLHFIKSCTQIDAEKDINTFEVLKNNLDNGLIKLYVQTDNGEVYRIEKSFGEEPQPYIDSTNRHVPFENIKKELTSDIFPAQMIEEIGRNNIARLDLIDRMLINEIEDYGNDIEILQIDLEKNAKDIQSHNQRLKIITLQLQEYTSVENDLKNHIDTPPEDINTTEKEEFEKQDAAEKVRSSEKRFFNSLNDKLNNQIEKLSEFSEEITNLKEFSTNTEKFFNKEVIAPISNGLDKILTLILKNCEINQNHLSGLITKVSEMAERLKILHGEQHNVFIKLKQKLEKHKEYYDKLNTLSKRVDERNVLLKDIDELKVKKDKLKSFREKDIEKLNKLKDLIFQKRLKKIDELNNLFDGKIKITLTIGGIKDKYENELRNALKGHNMRYNTIIPYIINNFLPDKFAQVIHNGETEKLKEISGIDLERSKAIMEALYETDAIYDIETIYCQDLPDFYLKVEKENDDTFKSVEYYKKSDELSTGQRCTTVLPIVFAISKNPLIIDQPEDNLDNKYISDTIHRLIKKQKDDRQLIFITHNANIPVLSWSEKNVFLKYKDKKSQIDCEGEIDQVKDNILNLLEGGKQAFEERKRLYNI